MRNIVRPELKPALPLLVILAVYFQSIYHPFSRFDDPFILEYYGINSTRTLLDVITPGNSFYFRPLISFSYWLDFQLWAMDPTFMHLENIVVHLINVLLVYLIARCLPAASEISLFPFLCALLFGLHPVNSESVNWIAGRTDVFAGVFILLAVYCLICALQGQSARYALIAFFVAFIGTLAKETAIMFLPTAFLMTVYWPVEHTDMSGYRAWRFRFLYLPILVSSCLVSSVLILIYVKRRGDNAVSMILEGGANEFVRICEAFGFYAKKLFLPLPLNVAIVKVDPLYVVAGIIAVCVLVAIFRRTGIPGIFFATAALFILPALIVAAIPIAWTPYGERYLYISSAFVVVGALELSYRFFLRWNAVKLFVPIVIVVIIAATVATFQRCLLWEDNRVLIKDIVSKSPDFGVARNEYGALLIQDGQYAEAENQFRIASKLNNQESVNKIIHLNLIGLSIHGKSPGEARRVLLSEIGTISSADADLLKLLYKCDESILGGGTAIENKRNIMTEMIEINVSLFDKTHDAHYFYRAGQLALSIGIKSNAATFFRKAYENAHPDAFYREPARRLAVQLVAE